MANKITIFRVLLAFYTLWTLFLNIPGLYISAFILTLFVILLDGLDGYIARKYNEESKLGSVLDILGDRIVENAYWIVFAALGWIGAWIPVVVMTRGIITDGIRGLALTEGFTAFGENSMNKSKIGNFITASRFSRFTYAGAKAIAFVLMIVVHIPRITEYKPMTIEQFFIYLQIQPILINVANIFAYIAVAFCVIRAIPVVLESKRFFCKND